MRLDALLSRLGYGSRSEVQRLIRRGAVAVDGSAARDPSQGVLPGASLSVDGLAVDSRIERTVMLHKPAGVLTAAKDPKAATVMDLLPPVYRSLSCMPVGRLDKDTTGILIFTSDGELNHRLLSPGRHVDKVYRALVQGTPGEEAVAAFAAGMDLGDFTAQGAKLTVLNAGPETSLAEVTVAEGKFHQVKRMFAAAGHEVLELHRRAFGPLELDPELREGEWRELTEAEVTALKKAAGMTA